MRALVLGLTVAVAGVAAAVATGATPPPLVRIGKPAFPPPMAEVTPSGALRFRIESTVARPPGSGPPVPEPRVAIDVSGPGYGGEFPRLVFQQPGTRLVTFGTGVIAGYGPQAGVKYAFDLRSFDYPPRSLVPRAYGPHEITWARQVGKLLVVQTNHLGYAADSGGRNGYLTGIDIASGHVAWRSPAATSPGEARRSSRTPATSSSSAG